MPTGRGRASGEEVHIVRSVGLEVQGQSRPAAQRRTSGPGSPSADGGCGVGTGSRRARCTDSARFPLLSSTFPSVFAEFGHWLQALSLRAPSDDRSSSVHPPVSAQKRVAERIKAGSVR